MDNMRISDGLINRYILFMKHCKSLKIYWTRRPASNRQIIRPSIFPMMLFRKLKAFLSEKYSLSCKLSNFPEIDFFKIFCRKTQFRWKADSFKKYYHSNKFATFTNFWKETMFFFVKIPTFFDNKSPNFVRIWDTLLFQSHFTAKCYNMMFKTFKLGIIIWLATDIRTFSIGS